MKLYNSVTTPCYQTSRNSDLRVRQILKLQKWVISPKSSNLEKAPKRVTQINAVSVQNKKSIKQCTSPY